jgi:hypothetical protein
VDATHSCSQIVMISGFTDTSFESALPHRLLGDRVMTENTVNMSTVSRSARLSELFLSTFCIFLSAPNLSCNRASVTLGGGVTDPYLQHICTSSNT